MLILIEMQITFGLFVLGAKHSVSRSELGHDQSAPTQTADEAPKDGVSDARHGSKHGGRRNLHVADRKSFRNESLCGAGAPARETARIVPILTHLAILLPSPSYAAVAQFASHNFMDDIARTSPAPAPDTGKWIGRLLIAVILGEGIWGLIVSITNNLILPFLARIMGTDARSPLSLGNGQFNVPGLFISVLELCFAGIVAVIVNSWIQRKPKPTRSKPVRVTPIPVQPAAPRPSPLSVVPAQAPEPAPQPAPIAVPRDGHSDSGSPTPDGKPVAKPILVAA